MSLRNALSMRAAALRRAPSPPPVTGRRRASSSDRRDHRRPQSRALSLSPRHRHNQKRPLSPNPGGLTPQRAQQARSWLRRTGDGDRAKRSRPDMEVEGQHDDEGSEGCQSDGGDRDTVCPEDDDPGFDAGDAEYGEGSEVDGPPLAPVERPRRGATQFCKAFKECTECGEELKPTDKLYKTTNSHHGCGTGVAAAWRSLALEDAELVESLKLMKKMIHRCTERR